MKSKFIFIVFIKFFIYGFFLSFLSFFLGDMVWGMKNDISVFEVELSTLLSKESFFMALKMASLISVLLTLAVYFENK